MGIRLGKPRLPQAFASLTVFVVLLGWLAWVDPRVQDKLTEVTAGVSVKSFASRATDLGDTVATAIRYQSFENAPMVLFATIGGVLFLFMVRT